MAIPPVNFQQIISAMTAFDKDLRNTDEWKDWETNKAQTYVIEYEGRRYPPKKIVSLATGVLVSTFVGGPETNEYLEKLGLKVIRLRELKINDALQLICERYKTARETESFKGGNSIRELFDECRRVLQKSEVVSRYPNIKVVSSYGKGNWATIPWISFLDLRVTNTTQDGTYIVILFNESGTGCYIKMAQGVTKPDKQYGVKAVEVLHQRAEELRSKYVSLKGKGFELSGVTDLGSDKKLAKLYEASTIASKYYQVGKFPSEDQVYKDLNDLLVCYDDYAKTRDSKTPPVVDSRDLVLIGTWREALSEFDQVKKLIDQNGAWAFWWSFRVAPEAEALIKKPFYLYINTGRGEIPVRLLIDDFRGSQGNDGIVSPWPEVTPHKWKNVTKLGTKQSEVFNTWARAIKFERIDKNIDDFEPVPGLSTRENLLNQMRFGYAYEATEEHEEETEDTVNDSLLELCSTAHNNITEASFRVQKSTIVRFAASLLAKRFVILTGLSGSGKTKLAHTFASWMSQQPQQYLMVAVGADWTSNENVLGYQDALQPNIYRKPTSRALELILRAGNDPSRPYFLILDEMNLSHVERYFADILSTIESDLELALHSAEKPLESHSGDQLPVPSRIRLPNNLFVIGTVNIDETTYMFSPKVLDRANVLEFRATADEIASFLDSPGRVDMGVLAGKGASYGRTFVAIAQKAVALKDLPPDIGDGTAVGRELQQKLKELFLELSPVGAEFGYRTALEINQFVYHHAALTGVGWQFKDALDAQVVQKIMPKLHGSDRKLRGALEKLKAYCVKHDLQLSLAKTERMLDRLAQDGFTSFAEA